MKEKLQEDIKIAMKAREQHKLQTLRGLHSEIKRFEIDNRKEIDEATFISIVQKEVKKRRDALEFAKQGARDDMIESNTKEIAILQEYLGDQLSESELRNAIQQLIDGGADNIGKIMGPLNQQYKGQFEGKLASEIAKDMLG